MKNLKKQLLLIAILFISVATFAQKEEMKAATKAISKSNFVDALASLNKMEDMTLDDKTKAKFLFLKSKALNGAGKIVESANAINQLMDFEKKISKSKYTKELAPVLNTLLDNLRKKASNQYNAGKWSLAKETLLNAYSLDKSNKALYEFAGNAAFNDQDYDKAIDIFKSLIDGGYTGVKEKFTATNVKTKEIKEFGTKNEMDIMMKTKEYENSKIEKTPSVVPNLYNNIAVSYLKLNKIEEAKKFAKLGRKLDGKNITLILSLANIEYKSDNLPEFRKLMNEALAYKPNDETIYYNLGIANKDLNNIEESIKNYEKAIELKPDYSSAWINLAFAKISDQDRIDKELDASLNDYDKYDKLIEEKLNLYRNALPTFLKAYEFNKSNSGLIKSIISIYQNLEQEDKVAEMRLLLDKLN